MIEMVAGVNRFLFVHFRPLYMVIFNFGKAIMKGHCKFWIFQSPPGVMAISSFVALLLVCAYLLLPPIFQPVIHNIEIPKTNGSIKLCNVFEGSWIQDESYPLYNSSLCPFAERGFNCLANGRRDQGYIKWRWRPKNCDIPKFDVHQVLEKLRGKRIVFVGDSLGRSQWESLICMLMTGVEDKKSVYEVNRNKITKQIRFLGVRFGSFDLRVDFYRSVFLVQPSSVSWRAPKRVKSTLKLDKLDGISKEWINSDVLIFNSGHWWTPSKLFELQGSLFFCKRFTEAWNAYHYWLQNSIKYMGVLG
ncbi:hypothetical protein K2173_023060 [Erythroxylum novogranatense]|uniref:Trichome birefringence-like N-terminal domain-containing protein n=1 Tax=Erythroxylum novogranatense TaxID=1862640 RepID=A0AAV8T992_9ROSI|nr:hypothetical protein K2173_023060 [Erythroxylum novogranatense]